MTNQAEEKYMIHSGFLWFHCCLSSFFFFFWNWTKEQHWVITSFLFQHEILTTFPWLTVMSDQPQTKEEAADEVQLNLLPGSGEEQNNLNHAISGRDAASCCTDSNYRKLAICSIICGLSCIGIRALIYSVKVLSGVFFLHIHSSQALLFIYFDTHALYILILYLIQQAEEARDPENAAEFSKRAKKFGIISIVLWFSLLASIPILMTLLSYLFTLQD